LTLIYCCPSLPSGHFYQTKKQKQERALMKQKGKKGGEGKSKNSKGGVAPKLKEEKRKRVFFSFTFHVEGRKSGIVIKEGGGENRSTKHIYLNRFYKDGRKALARPQKREEMPVGPNIISLFSDEKRQTTDEGNNSWPLWKRWKGGAKKRNQPSPTEKRKKEKKKKPSPPSNHRARIEAEEKSPKGGFGRGGPRGVLSPFFRYLNCERKIQREPDVFRRHNKKKKGTALKPCPYVPRIAWPRKKKPHRDDRQKGKRGGEKGRKRLRPNEKLYCTPFTSSRNKKKQVEN